MNMLLYLMRNSQLSLERVKTPQIFCFIQRDFRLLHWEFFDSEEQCCAHSRKKSWAINIDTTVALILYLHHYSLSILQLRQDRLRFSPEYYEKGSLMLMNFWLCTGLFLRAIDEVLWEFGGNRGRVRQRESWIFTLAGRARGN